MQMLQVIIHQHWRKSGYFCMSCTSDRLRSVLQ